MENTPEQLNSHNQPERPEVDPDSIDVLRAKLAEAESRVPRSVQLSEQGSHVDRQKVEESRKFANESIPQGMHTEIENMPLPVKAKDNAQAVEFANKLIAMADGDGDTLTKFLEDNSNT